MQIDDAAFPAPSLVPWSSVPPKAVARIGADYVTKAADNVSGFNLSAGAAVTLAPADLVQPVGAVLVISAP